MVGVLTDRKDAFILVKQEGEQAPDKFLLTPTGGTARPRVQVSVKALFIPNLVTLKWQRQGNESVVTEISALPPMPKRSAQVSGGKMVINFTLTGSLVGTVVARTSTDKECSIDVKPSEKQDFVACNGPSDLFRKAVKNGVLDLKAFQVVKQDFTECYWPPYVLDKVTNKAGMDPKVIETIRTLNPGDKVKMDWYYDERKRASKIEVLSRALAKGT